MALQRTRIKLWTMVTLHGLVFLLLPVLTFSSDTEREQSFDILENQPTDTPIGNIAAGLDANFGPPYQILQIPSDLKFDVNTGEIRTGSVLDRERVSQYKISVFNDKFRSILATITVLDENDESPQFTMKSNISLSESSNVGSSIHIGSAVDNDAGNNGILADGYSIISGNDDGTFHLKGTLSGKKLLLSLEVKKALDYETVKSYDLVIQVRDGGKPFLFTNANLKIEIQDANDNTPKFEFSKYDATVKEDVSVGKSILQVTASDDDSGDYAKITYSLTYRNDDPLQNFVIDPETGVISLDKPLNYEDKKLYQFTAKATDGGSQVDTAVVEIIVQNVNEQPANINIKYLINGTQQGHIAENTQVGSLIARISVSDPDTPTVYYTNINVTLQGAGHYFELITTDRVIFNIKLKSPLDRESMPSITFTILAVDSGSPPLQASKVVTLHIVDVNDNTPVFDKNLYVATVQEQAAPGSSVISVHASDNDTGNNAKLFYSIAPNPANNSNWFQIDSQLGLITVQGQKSIDCEENSNPWIIVRAEDSGVPPRTGSTYVSISVLDVNDMAPQFEQTYYPVTVAENVKVGKCILKVSAQDQDCNGNIKLNYKLSNITLIKVDKFSLDPATGELCIVNPLDYEKDHTYEFPVFAVDTGGLSGNSMITITVTDVNDNRPQFYPRNYSQNIDQNEAKQGREIITVQATDADKGTFGEVTYRIVAGDSNGKFSINTKTGLISLSQTLPLEEKVYIITIEAVDGGGLKSQQKATVYISVTGSGYPRPKFEKATYSFFISEDQPPRTFVGQVKATVANAASQGIRYSIISGDINGNFYIDQVSGRIHVGTNATLDRELKAFILLNVMAETDTPPVFGKAQVNVSISDVNDNAPQFTSHQVQIHVFEDEDKATTIYSALATDRDNENNGTVRYRFERNAEDTFQIDPISGEIRLLKHLDYEETKEYRLVIVAYDLGSPVSLQSNMTLTVSVTNRNDNPPIFSKLVYNTDVIETENAGVSFLQVNASDLDLDQITFNLQPDPSYDAVFGIYPNTGYLYLKRKLDRETRSAYLLTVIAKDNGKPNQMSATAKINVKVTDANDNDPSFTEDSYFFQITENVAITTVGFVSATDIDIGVNAELSYKFLTNPNNFVVNPFTGEITTNGVLDRETKERYELVVHVSDKGDPVRSDTAQVIIMLTDVNDNKPKFSNKEPVIGTVNENEPKGTKVIHMTAEDPDAEENGTISYYFYVNGGRALSAEHFSIDPKTGQITTSEVLDFEAKNRYELTVGAMDHGPVLHVQSTEIKILITVIDHDEREIIPDIKSTVYITENIPVGSKIAQVSLSNTNRVSYYEFAGNVFELFMVNKTTGEVYCVKDVDYEMASSHKIGIHAVDQSSAYPKTSTIELTVNVQDVNDNAPEFDQDLYVISKPENLPLGRIVQVFTATDRDSGLNGTIKYRLFHQSATGDYFQIDENTGALTIKSVIDYEQIQEILLVVQAEDQSPVTEARLKSSVTVKVKVVDVNDNSPVFNTYARFYVSEKETVGYPITQVVAVDTDSIGSGNGLLTYQIVGGNDGNKFSLEAASGLLRIHQSLDRESKSLYNLNISASDHGVPPQVSFTTLSVQIEDVNDNPPRFEKSTYTGHVTENVQSTDYVLSVSATDKDDGVNKELVYILPRGNAEDVFSLNSKTGALTIKRPLDREHRSSYEFTVYVSDKGQPTLYDKAKVIVYVDDVNDNAPVFNASLVELYIPENMAQTGVFTVIANDADEGENGKVTYSITGGNSRNDFTINRVSGRLSCKALDREKQDTYNLTITAMDKHSLMSHINVVVHVQDINDNKPVFVLHTYPKRLREDVEVGTMVLLVSASDSDQGDNGRITYSLGNDTDGMFRVDSVTGNITTAGNFDRETKSSYRFHLVAEDNGEYNRGRTTATIEVVLENVNDNAPVFQNVPYSKSVSQNTASDTFVLKVIATDLDNAKIHYSFGSTSQQKALQYFSIDKDSGDISTSRVLSTDALGFHYLHVIANDLGTPAKSTTGVVQIKVGSGSAYPNIEFTQSVYNSTVPENSNSGAEVVTVTATIVNQSFGTITYDFLEGNDQNIFSISGNGQITVNSGRLDYEKDEVLRLIVSARSGQLHGYAMVEVHVQDVNDNSPRFAQNPYYASINEDVNIGTTVIQVVATDADSGSNGAITYNIFKQSQDQSFKINNQGYITTRLPLDFEVKDKYTIEIEAVDHGSVPKSSVCEVRISVIDINDQQPNFPSNPQPKNISEGTAVGALVAQVTANDIDKYPPLLYDFDTDGNQDNRFAIDKFSGKIYLAKMVDHEEWNHYTIGVQVTDQNNVAQSKLDIYVMDVNDNSPVFTDSSYEGSVAENTGAGVSVLTVSATDKDKGDRLIYSIETATASSFTIEPYTGVISTKQQIVYQPDQTTVQLTVMVRDDGSPSLSSAVLVYIEILPVNQYAPRFTHSPIAISIKEDTQKGISITRVQATDNDNYQTIDYIINSGNINDAFYIGRESGAVYTNKPLDREETEVYTLQIAAQDRINPILSSSIDVTITLDDVNDNSPKFEKTSYSVSLKENYPAGNSFTEIKALDADKGHNQNLSYSILSGDDDDLFMIDSSSGILKIQSGKNLDYEENTEHKLVIEATDCVGCLSGAQRLSEITELVVTVTDVNDHVPFFPVPSYFVIFNENQDIGTKVLHVKAEDGDSGEFGQLTYTISDDTYFRIHPTTGEVFSKIEFDVENLPGGKEVYELQVTAMDSDKQSDRVDVVIRIGDVDESTPAFVKTSYGFTVPGNAKVGTVLGRVTATDTDKGQAGKIFYFLNHPNDYLDVNVATGDVYVKLAFHSDPPERKKRDTNISRHKRALTTGSFSLVIEARSAVENPKKQTTIVEITVDQSCEGCQLGAKKIDDTSGGFEGATMIVVIVLAVLLVIAAIIVAIVVFRYRKNKKEPTTVAQVYEGDFSDTFDFSQPSRPPNYNDVVQNHYNRSNSNNVTASSDASEHSHHSVSSGRGSVEAEDDEEICMINSLSNDLNNSSGYRSKNMPDSGIQDDDTTSEPSVQNSKDYLARLGIDSTHIPTKSKNFSHTDTDSLPPYNEVNNANMSLTDDPLDLSNLDYEKLVQMDTSHPSTSAPQHISHHNGMNHQKDLGFHEPEPQYQGSLSNVINSEEEYSGSYNWDYLLDWGPQYQPLAHVFSEIARLKDDTIQPKKRPVQTVPQNNINSALKSQGTKMFPPPIITNAPPTGIQPASSRSSQSSGSSSSIKLPRTNHRGNKNVSHPNMTRSPITNDAGYTAPLTPSFTPSLSPLATSGPSMTPAGSSNVNMGPMSQHTPMGQSNRGRLGHGVVLIPPQESEQELRI